MNRLINKLFSCKNASMFYKRQWFFLLLLLSGIFVQAQINSAEIKQLEQYIKLWGFLKYYHPTVAKGKQDWDSVFMLHIQQVKNIPNKTEANLFYKKWIDDLGEPTRCKTCNDKIKDAFYENLDLNWLADTSIFSNELIEKLIYIKNNRNQQENFYVKQNPGVDNTNYANEKPYKNNPYPGIPMRMLSLARYWNIIEYFFPYKYMTDQKWNTVLPEMIPQFYEAADTTAHHLAMNELVAKIDDSHAFFFTKYNYLGLYGSYTVPFETTIIDDKAVIYKILNDSLCKMQDLQIGDVITTINGKTIKDIFAERTKYLPASNAARKKWLLAGLLFNGKTNSITIGFEVDGKEQRRNIIRYDNNATTLNYQIITDTFRLLNDKVGYANMDILLPKQVPKMMQLFENTKAIVLDLRGYTKSAEVALATYVSNGEKEYMSVFIPYMKYPGVFTYVKNPGIGKRNRNHYKGKLIVLVNEITQSQAEFAALIFKTFPNTIVIGSQTSGANGNVSTITFPGGYETLMTGIGIANPDRSPTQRIGIVPDIIVKPTIKAIKERRDELLEKALQLAVQ